MYSKGKAVRIIEVAPVEVGTKYDSIIDKFTAVENVKIQ